MTLKIKVKNIEDYAEVQQALAFLDDMQMN